MPFTLTMPKLSPTMEEGIIVKWHKKEGDFVSNNDLLLEVATDKATVEYQAMDEGWLRQILVKEGGEAFVNQPVAVFSADIDEGLEGYQPEGMIALAEIEKKQEGTHDQNQNIEDKGGHEKTVKKNGELAFSQPQFVPEPPVVDYQFQSLNERLQGRVLASPLAKKLAKEKGIDLTTVKGSGPNERIMCRDLERAQPAGIAGFNRRDRPTSLPGTFEEIPLSPMRKVIAQRLQESKTFIPHFYLTQVIDVEPLISIREQLKTRDVKISVNDFIVKACALALRDDPTLNAGFNSVNQSIIQFKTIDIAVAVSLEGGLITPIIRYADVKNLGEIALEIRQLAQRAREGKLNPEEYKGGSFTISNLGMYGISHFQAILNPPQAAILAVGGIQDVPVIRNGAVVPGKTLALTLSVDHRVIDGVAAAIFLQKLKKIVENPAVLMLF